MWGSSEKVNKTIFIKKVMFIYVGFFTKQATLMRRSTILSLFPQLVFTESTHAQLCMNEHSSKAIT
jgi:hypothetical protein